jgi:hypothetical protein
MEAPAANRRKAASWAYRSIATSPSLPEKPVSLIALRCSSVRPPPSVVHKPHFVLPLTDISGWVKSQSPSLMMGLPTIAKVGGDMGETPVLMDGLKFNYQVN